MSLVIECDRCSEPLLEQGALLFSPPSPPADICVKVHLYRRCYSAVMEWLSEVPPGRRA